MNKNIILVIILALVIVAIFGLTKSRNQTPSSPDEEKVSINPVVLAGSSNPLYDFHKPTYETALKSDKLIVLYFYNNTCPICRVELPEALYPAFNELKDGNVIGFRVNFNDSDTDQDERALAQEFGVPYQHTKVFVKKGERVLKSPEQWGKSRYIMEINKAIEN